MSKRDNTNEKKHVDYTQRRGTTNGRNNPTRYQKADYTINTDKIFCRGGKIIIGGIKSKKSF